MAARKRAAKKTAAPETTEQEKNSFPLRKDHYFYMPAVSRHVHSGADESDRAAIVQIQVALGVKPSGFYDAETMHAVTAWRSEQGLPSSGLVDADAWAQLVGE